MKVCGVGPLRPQPHPARTRVPDVAHERLLKLLVSWGAACAAARFEYGSAVSLPSASAPRDAPSDAPVRDTRLRFCAVHA